MGLFKAASVCKDFPPAMKIFIRNACTKLFVGGLSYDTNEPVLKGAFKQFGEILEVKVICDHTSGKSKGFGFVLYSSESEASTALEKMNGQVITHCYFYSLLEHISYSSFLNLPDFQPPRLREIAHLASLMISRISSLHVAIKICQESTSIYKYSPSKKLFVPNGSIHQKSAISG